MNIIKKAATTLAVSALLIGTVVTIPTYASNFQDTDFNFTMDTKTVYSELRQKTDASSVYLKCKSSSREGGIYNAKVYASATKTSEKKDLSAGHTYKVGAGQTKRMINKVNEKGYFYACIQATRNYMYSSIFINVWSPDSV